MLSSFLWGPELSADFKQTQFPKMVWSHEDLISSPIGEPWRPGTETLTLGIWKGELESICEMGS